MIFMVAEVPEVTIFILPLADFQMTQILTQLSAGFKLAPGL